MSQSWYRHTDVMELWHLKNVFLPKRTASKYRLLALRSAQAICIYFFFSCPHAAVQNRDTMTAFAHAVMRPCLQDYKAAPMPMPSCLTHPFHTGEGQNIFLSKKKVQISLSCTGPALCFLGSGAKPKLEAPNKQNIPTSLYQLQSLFRCIIKKILMVKTIACKYIKSITGIPNPYLLNRWRCY